ncbi:T9SS type A sorting domain-containing protein [Paracrocinitomix mangrovi]|uniref:T9SS type A sorting domain-containing protein n=1 Tax=Paracrocinitomix mangrovi TaxID=2862509 RepID=UPI001C8ED625|nr:T9SS type A sorting domain-containing protein [Paracrocinitomix mangrovi]UKN00443.1 T9SS type A sorting domain-containing protein [Paracrocinitomix mangrovi]
MRRILTVTLSLIISCFSYAQSWQDVGGGTNNSSHGMLVWNGKLVNLGSYNNPCNRVATWDGTQWECLDGGVGIVARAGCVWEGKLVVVGDFWNNFQPCPGCNGVAVWDGVSWSALDQGFNNDVLTCTVHNGDLYIGGDFTQANGVPINRVAKWDTNSNSFVSVGNTTAMDNDVRCMVSYDGQLWVGGDFNNVDGCSPCDGLVKWDETNQVWEGGNSGVDLVGGVNETVRVLFVNPSDGDLYMGGEFPELWDGDAMAEDFNMSYVARYDGSNWYPLGTGLNEYCRAIHDYNGDVIIGGYFTNAGGTPAEKIVKWNPIAQTFTAMGGGFDGVGIDEYVKSAMTWNGIFFAGGAYTQAEGGPMNYIAQWYEPPTSSPVANINASTTQICVGSCVTFADQSSNSPNAWTWTFNGADVTSSNSQNPGNICYSNPGFFTVDLQACNGNGCDLTSVTIEVVDVPTVSGVDQNICDGSSVTLTATPSVSGGTYLWSPGNETTSSITVNPSTTSLYSVVYTLNGCASAQEDITVTVNPAPTLSVNSTTICEGATATLTATPSVGGGTYNWAPNGEITSTITVSPSTTTSYQVQYSANGCPSNLETAVVTVNPSYNANESTTVCEGNSYTFPDGSSQVINTTVSHTSNLTSIDGCDSIIVTTVNPQQVYNGTESVTVCEGSTYVYPDGFSEQINVASSHTSSLTSTAGCDSIIVTNVTPQQAFNSTESVSVCEGATHVYPDGFSEQINSATSHTSSLTSISGCDSIIVTNVSVNTIYNETENVDVCEGTAYIFPDGTSSTITSSMQHSSSLSSINGCDSVIVTNVNMLPAPVNTVTQNGITLSADQTGAVYQWLDCITGMSNITGETNQTYSPTSNGSYAVTVNLNGCEATSACVDVSSIGWEENDLAVNIYPNPANNFFIIKLEGIEETVSYEMYDASGRIVRSGIFNVQVEIDVEDLENGVYHVQLSELKTVRLIKM